MRHQQMRHGKKAEKEKTPGETAHIAYPNESDAVPEKVHEVFHN